MQGGGGDASSFLNATNAEVRFEIKEVSVHVAFCITLSTK